MSPQKIIFLLLITISCSHQTKSSIEEASSVSRGEIILSSNLILKIHDEVMPPLKCVEDRAEAELFLRVMRPRLDEVDLYLSKELDTNKGREAQKEGCFENCTCEYLYVLIKENKVPLTAAEKKDWDQTYHSFKKDREKQCLSYIQQSFCDSALMNDLENEKDDFMVEE